MNHTKTFIGLVSIVVLMTGCARLTHSVRAVPNVYVHPEFKRIQLHDIGILPLSNESRSRKDIAGVVTGQFISELNKRGWYVLHLLSQEDLTNQEKMSHIDALLTGRILEYNDIEPLKFGIQMTLTDLETKETLWSVQKVYDGNQVDVAESVKEYYNTAVKNKYPVMGHKIYLLSMNRFLEFVFSAIAETLK